MANTRFNYDEYRTMKLLQESTDPGRYMLNKPGCGNKPLFFEDPHIRMQQWGANIMHSEHNSMVDVESFLDGRNRKINRYCYNNEFPKLKSTKADYNIYNKSFTEQTNYTNPSWVYREKYNMKQTRWDFPLKNNLKHPIIPFNHLLDTRNLEKDNYLSKLKNCH